MNANITQQYSGQFSNTAFWKKLARHARAAGKRIVEEALVLYYAWNDPEVPAWAKAAIIGALGYFISPLDAIPDIIPVVGYSDDATVLAAAVLLVKAWLKEEHRQRARETMSRWSDMATVAYAQVFRIV